VGEFKKQVGGGTEKGSADTKELNDSKSVTRVESKKRWETTVKGKASHRFGIAQRREKLMRRKGGQLGVGGGTFEDFYVKEEEAMHGLCKGVQLEENLKGDWTFLLKRRLSVARWGGGGGGGGRQES